MEIKLFRAASSMSPDDKKYQLQEPRLIISSLVLGGPGGGPEGGLGILGGHLGLWGS